MLSKDHKQTMSLNTQPKEILPLKESEVIEYRKLQWGASRFVFFTRFCYRDQILENEICQVCSEYGSNGKSTRTVGTKTRWKETMWQTQTFIGV